MIKRGRERAKRYLLLLSFLKSKVKRRRIGEALGKSSMWNVEWRRLCSSSSLLSEVGSRWLPCLVSF